jgi:hypothetical protein
MWTALRKQRKEAVYSSMLTMGVRVKSLRKDNPIRLDVVLIVNF